MHYTLWNLISTLKNGSMAKKRVLCHRRKKMSEMLLKVLWDEGFILGYRVSPDDNKSLEIFLKFDFDGNPAIKRITGISKPGKRVYFSAKQLWKLKQTSSSIVVSTNLGLRTLVECKKLNLGGELVVAVN